MHRGYIKIWRKSIDGGWLKDPELWALWCWFLLKASHKPIKILVGLKEVELEPGQFIFGLYAASEELGMSIQKIRTRIDFLEKSGNITRNSTNKFTIISIVNWDIYQDDEIINNKRLTSKQQTNNKQITTNNNEEHINTKRIKEYSSDFEIFYKAYPNKKAPDAAWKAWKKRNGSLPPVDELLEAIGKQKKWRENAGPGDFRPEWKNPATWLNAGSWNDEVNCDDTNGGVGEWLRLKKLEGLS